MNIKDLPQGSYKVLGQPTGQPLTAPTSGGMVNVKDLPQNSYKVISGQPIQAAQPKPFRYDIPVAPLPQEDRQVKAKRLQKEAEVAQKEYKSKSGFGGFLKEIGGIAASSELALGKTIAKVSGDPTLNTATQNIGQLTDTNLRLIRQIRENEKTGKDSTGLKRQFNLNADIIEKNGGDISKYEAELPTNAQALGQIGGTALDVLTAGTYGAAAKGMKTGALAKNSLPAFRVFSRTVAPKVTKVADIASRTTGIATKQGIKNVGKGASIGYGYDVSEGLQGNRGEGRTGANAFVPGAGTAISALLPGMTETSQSFKNRKLNAIPKIIEGRENELAQIEGNYQKLRKAQEYSQDANAAIRREIASSDVLVGAVDAEGTIRTKQPGGAVEKYKKLNLDEAEDVVRKNLVRLDERVNLSVVEDQLLKAIDESGLEGSDLRTALNGVKKEISGYRLKADKNGDVPLYLMHDAKISTTKNINYQTPPETKAYRKAIARGLKKTVENNSKFNTEEVNSVIAKYMKGIEYLENLDGRKVKGGRLGKYFAQATGNITGMLAGGAIGGIPGMVVGSIVGGEVSGKIKGQSMAGTFGGEIGKVPEKSPILQKAIQQGNLPPEPITVNNYLNRSRNGIQNNQYISAPKIPPTRMLIKSKVNNNSNIIVQNDKVVNGPPGQVARPADLKYNGPVKQGIVKVNNYQNPDYPSYRTPDQIKAETTKLEYKANKDKNFDIKRPLKAFPGSKMGQNGAETTQGIQTVATIKKAAELTKKNGGVTIKLNGDVPLKGYAVAPSKATEKVIPKELFTKDPERVIMEYIDEHWEKLQEPNAHLGGWINSNGDFVADVSHVVENPAEAAKLAKNGNQDAFINLESFEETPRSKYEQIIGDDEAKTRGNKGAILQEGSSNNQGKKPGNKKELKPGLKTVNRTVLKVTKGNSTKEYKLKDFADENGYVYHTTSPNNIDGISEQGLKLSEEGYQGKGVYFAPDEASTIGQASYDGATIRVNINKLDSKYVIGADINGFDSPSELVYGKSIPPEAIEIKTNKGWKSLKDKGTTQMFGAVAGVEVDEDGNIKFDVNKAIAGMAVLGISSNKLKVKELWKSWEKIQQSKVGKSGSFVKAAELAQKKIEELANKLEDIPNKSELKSGIKSLRDSSEDSLISEARKYKTTINIKDKNDLDYLGRILSQDNIADIKAGKMTNFRGTSYEDLAKVNIISETPKTIEQQLAGKIKDVKLKSDTFYHGTSAENASGIMKNGFKKGSELPEETFRGGGYGKMQSSISLTETPKDASRFSTLSKNGEIVEVKLKKNAKVVSIEGVEDAMDLEDYTKYLEAKKIDAVYLGGGEKELVIINSKAITPTKSQLTDIWKKAQKKIKELANKLS